MTFEPIDQDDACTGCPTCDWEPRDVPEQPVTAGAWVFAGLVLEMAVIVAVFGLRHPVAAIPLSLVGAACFIAAVWPRRETTDPNGD